MDPAELQGYELLVVGPEMEKIADALRRAGYHAWPLDPFKATSPPPYTAPPGSSSP